MEDPYFQQSLASYRQANALPQNQPMAQPAAQGPQGQQFSQPGQPKAIFTLGDGSTVDDSYAAQLAQQYLGLPVSGVTATGTELQLQNGQTIPIQQVMAQLGVQVSGFKPMNAEYSSVSPQIRAAIQSLPDDFRKRQYINALVQNENPEGPIPLIQGSGDDWFVFDHQGGKWHGITNEPGFDMSDVAGASHSILKTAGAVGGGLLGAAGGLGVGSVPGAIAGAAAGGAGADALGRAAWEMLDPNYQEVRQGMSEKEVLADLGITAAQEGLGAAGGLGAAKVLGGLAAPISAAMQPISKITTGVGDVLGRVGRAADTPLGHDVAAALIPVASEAQLFGAVVQAPGFLSRGMVRGAGRIGESKTLHRWAQSENPVLAGIAGKVQDTARRFSNTASGSVAGAGPREIFGNLGEAAEKGMAGLRTPRAEELSPFMSDAAVYARGLGGAEGKAAEAWTSELGRGLWRDAQRKQAGATGRSIGEKFGGAIQGLENIGKSAEELARGIARPVVKAARHGGAALEGLGSAGENLAQFGKGIGTFKPETQLYSQMGAEEAVSRLKRANMLPMPGRDDRERWRTYLAEGY